MMFGNPREPGERRPETVATVPEHSAGAAEVRDIVPLLEQIATQATQALGENLISLLLYGSHPRGEARPSSDVNIMVVVTDSSSKAMAPLLTYAQEWSKAGTSAPVVVAAMEFLDSQDTLALEYLDIAAARQVLAGHDLFATFTPDWDIVRHALEQEARRKAIILMKRWLASAGSGREARRIITDTIPGYVAMLRGLILFEQRAARPLHAKEVLATLDGTRGLDPSVWRQLYAVGREYRQMTTEQLAELMNAYVDESQKLMRYVDSLDSTHE